MRQQDAKGSTPATLILPISSLLAGIGGDDGWEAKAKELAVLKRQNDLREIDRCTL